MAQTPHYIADLKGLIDSFPPDSILSRTVFQDQGLKVILFGFQPGQELSEHTASVPAILHFLSGQAELVLGQERHTAGPGTWVQLPANLPHSIQASEETLMLLTMITQGGS